MDGVCESKSSTVSLDVYSCRFKKCRYVYPSRIVRPLKKEYIDNNEQLRRFLYDIRDNSVEIDNAVADNPKRSNMKGCQCHSAMFPCEYCFVRGVRCTNKKSRCDNPDHTKKLIKEKIKRIENLTDSESKKTLNVLKQILTDIEHNANDKERKVTVFPSNTANCELRTKDNIMEIIALIENHDEDEDPLTRDDLKGVKCRSLFIDIEYFDIVNNFPTEYMHLACLGVVKRLTELTFNVGINRSRITNRKLSSTKMFNFLMSQTKSVFEFSRRSRDLDFSVYKAEEFRNLSLFFFPHVLACIEADAKERELWLYLTFMLRSCTMPDSEYFNMNINQISVACSKFYKIYEKIFGKINCTYSIHVLCSHLPQIRLLGPLTETSAFKFESFYGELRNSFVPGTPSTLKQMFENVMLKRSLGGHSCEKDIYLSNYDTALTSDSLIYTYTDTGVSMYQVLDVIDDDIICNPQGKFPCEFNETPELSWSSVGVFKKGPSSSENVKLSHSSVAGKVLKVGDYLITCAENVLKEK